MLPSSASVLERLSDPLAYQILPSRARAGAASASASHMPPPPPCAPRPLACAPLPREALPTPDYEAALDHIIERAFFPDLPRMRQQLQWLEALDSGDRARIAAAREGISASVRRSRGVVSATPLSLALGRGSSGGGGSGGTVLSSWSIARRPSGGAGGAPAAAAACSAAAAAGGGDAGSVLALADFQARFTSQDDSVFRSNMSTRLLNLQRRVWWLHCDPRRARGGPTPALLLDAAAPAPLGGLPQRGSWPWRARSALFFAPTLAASNDISGVQRARPNPHLPAGAPLLLLQRDSAPHAPPPAPPSQPSLSASYAGLDLCAPPAPRARARARPPPPRIPATRRGASALSTLSAAGAAALGRDAAHSAAALHAPRWNGVPLLHPLALALPATGATSGAPPTYSLLPTPIIHPSSGSSGGGGEMEPIITWGRLAGPPMLLRAAGAVEESPPAPLHLHTGAGLRAAFGLAAPSSSAAGGGGEEEEAYQLPHPTSRQRTHDALLGRLADKRAPQQQQQQQPLASVTGALLSAAEQAARGGVMAGYKRRAAAGFTPLFFAGGGGGGSVVSGFTGGGGGGGGGGGAASAMTGRSGGSSRATHKRAAEAMAGLPPAGRAALAAQVAAQAAAAGRVAGGGELAGIFAPAGGASASRSTGRSAAKRPRE